MNIRIHRTTTRAFTLIELLVVIAIIALLISILLPSLASARGLARQLVGAALHKNLGAAQIQYMNTYKDHYAGRNTSGGYYSGIYIGQNPVAKADLLLGDTTSETPTSTEDWISPIIGDAMNFSPNRARRTQQIFNRLRDPAARFTNDTLYGTAPDNNDFRTALADGGYYQVSFLIPTGFNYLSNSLSGSPDCPRFGQRPAMTDFAAPAVSPRNFRPRLDLVGIQLSQKALILDGTRYHAAGNTLDFDIAHNPSIFGSFTDNPAYQQSTAYGREANSSSSGNGWKLSARHPNNSMNVTFFDGHTAAMKISDLWREPKYVYPSGTVYNGTDGTPEAIAKYPSGTILE